MRLKSFYARTTAEAMRQVRAALGDDAIIVATREEEGGVRVTAAVEDDALPPPPAAPAGRLGTPAEPEPVDISEALGEVLYRHGTPAALAEKLVDAVASLDVDNPLMALGAALDAVFTFQPLPDGRQERPILLVGPPGAGKTLAVAKLAARAVFAGRSVSVITTDTLRAGAVEQLAAFTRLMKIKLTSVEEGASLADALEVIRDGEVYIDSGGRNPFDAQDMGELRRMMGKARVEPVLVLPAGSDALEAAEMGAAFRALGVRRVLVTRVDLTRRLGSTLAAVYDSRLDFCDISNNPKVPDGLTTLTPLGLARLMMPEAAVAAATVAARPAKPSRPPRPVRPGPVQSAAAAGGQPVRPQSQPPPRPIRPVGGAN